jgi:hypothetical protein
MEEFTSAPFSIHFSDSSNKQTLDRLEKSREPVNINTEVLVQAAKTTFQKDFLLEPSLFSVLFRNPTHRVVLQSTGL